MVRRGDTLFPGRFGTSGTPRQNAGRGREPRSPPGRTGETKPRRTGLQNHTAASQSAEKTPRFSVDLYHKAQINKRASSLSYMLLVRNHVGPDRQLAVHSN